MKKFSLLAAFLAVGLSISAYAEQVKTPTMQGDNPSIEYAGVSIARLNNTAAATFVSSNAVVVYGVSASSVAATAYVSFYDTNTVILAGATAARLQYNDNAGADEDVTATWEYPWVRPILFKKGLVIKPSVTPGTADWQEWIVYYREAK